MSSQKGKAMKQLSEFIDATVVDANGDPVGSIDELVVNCQTGKIDRVIVRKTNRIRFCLEWTDLLVRGRHFILKREVRS